MGITSPEDLRKTPVVCWLVHRCRDVARRRMSSRKRCWRSPYCLFESCLLLTLYVGKGETGKRENDAEASGKLKMNSTARQGGCHMEYRMFDIGVN